MALKLKKAFQLGKETEEAIELNHLSADVAVSLMLLNTARQELTNSMSKRNDILKNVLLDNCNYILTQTDKVQYLEQTSEIRVYESNGTTQEEITKPFED